MQNNRPWFITAICLLSFAGSLLSIPIVFSDLAKQVGPWYPPFLALCIITGIICMTGFWFMKKWGFWVYTAAAIVIQIVLLFYGYWNVISFAVPAVVIAIVLSQYKLMD